MSKPIWIPSRKRSNASRLAEFTASTGLFDGREVPDYDLLWQYSVESPSDFWRDVWEFCGVIGETGKRILEHNGHMADAQFFPDAALNFAENLLQQTGPKSAIIFHAETGARRTISHDELRALVSQLQQSLQALGVGRGDRVAGYLPNMPETVAAMLATASLGAVWSSCSPDFGLNGVLDRFGQIKPKVVFCADGYHYNGKQFSSLPTVQALSETLECIQAVVVVPHLGATPDISSLGSKFVALADFIGNQVPKELEFTPVDFAHPLYIMFSSGTTGAPKCIMHSVGGTLIQHLKEHQLQCDIKPGDRLLYFTTCGWMMWNWQASALASGATLVLFDGSPFFPDGNRMAEIVACENVTQFGTSAKYIDSCAKADIRPIDNHAFPALRSIFSTGSPLSEAGFEYIYASWKSDLFLASIAGGTDILGCFVGGNPISPVFSGQSQCRLLGMDVQVFDAHGGPTKSAGDLVNLSPHPSMPIGFLNDPDGKRYQKSYFDRFSGVWCQGDWVKMTPEGGFVFHGRSDATLNPGGVRIGTAEIYRQVERLDEIREALVIGQNWDNDVRVVLFVTLQPDKTLDPTLIKRIKNQIRSNASPRHVPALIIEVADMPRTKSGKIVELAVRDIVHGRPIQNIESLANPQALERFRGMKELA